jgi:hypothetical protein
VLFKIIRSILLFLMYLHAVLLLSYIVFILLANATVKNLGGELLNKIFCGKFV